MVSKEGKHKMDSLRPAAWANQHVAYSGQMERKKFSNVHQLTPTPIPLFFPYLRKSLPYPRLALGKRFSEADLPARAAAPC
jgi:hypothetical protein